jgi:alpha-galactosidase
VDIQRGFLQFFPPEIMGAHVGTAPAHTTGRTQAMAFRAAVALSGHFGVELDVRHLNEADTAELRGWIAVYKQLRDRLHHGRVWTGDAGDGVRWQFHADEADEAVSDGVLIALRTRPSDHRYAPTLRLPMLDVAAQYRVREIRPDGAEPEAREMDGAWLVHAGLPMPRAHAETAFLVRVERV